MRNIRSNHDSPCLLLLSTPIPPGGGYTKYTVFPGEMSSDEFTTMAGTFRLRGLCDRDRQNLKQMPAHVVAHLEHVMFERVVETRAQARGSPPGREQAPILLAQRDRISLTNTSAPARRSAGRSLPGSARV